MLPFDQRRRLMVDTQIAARGISDPAVLDAMLRVPRHRFVPEDKIEEAYEDQPLPIGCEQTISQPYIVALMTQAVRPRSDFRVLDVGTGSGYQAAVLSRLAGEVFTLELIPKLAQRAASLLRELGCRNVHSLVADGSDPGFLRGRFDGILVAAAAAEVPEAYYGLLAEGARLIIPVGGRGVQQLACITRTGSRFSREDLTGCVFVPLRGAQGQAGTGRDGWP